MASKPQQILHLNPSSEILFEGPFDKVVTSYLEIHNPSEEKVCFKVKTTAPRRYCVRPNSGIVSPGSKMRIAIMLQPIEQESQSERNKHKFMVQSTIVKDNELSSEELWKTVSSSDIMDSKLRCVFGQRRESQSNEEKTTTSSTAPTSTSTSATMPAATITLTTTSTPISESRGKDVGVASSTTQFDNLKSVSPPSEPTQQTERDNKSAGDAFNRQQEPITSTPTRPTRHVTSSSTPSRAGKEASNWEQYCADRDAATSHNLTSFLQPMSNDHKVVLVSLLMLILGVILGKYII